jgi:deferrochelatase/peroxidase EfeB
MQAPKLPEEALADIQGFITSGYGHLKYAAYLFLTFTSGENARKWIARVIPSITSARSWPTTARGERVKPASALNVAFTAAGLEALNLPQNVLCTFPAEFQEGIAADHRSRILGDTEESAPSEWELGAPAQPPLHALVFAHATSTAGLEQLCRSQRALMAHTEGGVAEISGSMQSGYRPDGDHEPFGFHDGVGQPKIAGISADGVPTGEFILGYPNHYSVVPPTPVVPAALDAANALPALGNPYHASANVRDLGANGSFVVYRKLRQDVAGFWQFMKREAVRATGREDPAFMVWLASRFVGRWPSGTALMIAPDADRAELRDRNDFLYGSDPDGRACPIGAHIRRTNPRDDLKPYPAKASLSMSEAHRLLRRARVFGPPLFDPELLLDHSSIDDRLLPAIADDGQPRGIHFFCVNASIRSQFEFVQQTWCNNPRFGGLSASKDPLVGDNDRTGEASSHLMIPGTPRDHHTAALPRFVTVKAGAYLFMPSLKALRFLSTFVAIR